MASGPIAARWTLLDDRLSYALKRSSLDGRRCASDALAAAHRRFRDVGARRLRAAAPSAIPNSRPTRSVARPRADNSPRAISTCAIRRRPCAFVSASRQHRRNGGERGFLVDQQHVDIARARSALNAPRSGDVAVRPADAAHALRTRARRPRLAPCRRKAARGSTLRAVRPANPRLQLGDPRLQQAAGAADSARPCAEAACRLDRCRRRPAAPANRRSTGTCARRASRCSRARHRARRRSARDASPATRRTDCRRDAACGRSRTCSAIAATGAIIGFASENSSYCSRSGCSCCIHSAIGGVDHRANHRLREGAIEREIDLARRAPRSQNSARRQHRCRQARGYRRASALRNASPSRRSTRSGLGDVRGLRLEDRLVEAGRQHVDQVDIAGELAVLLRATPPETKMPR